MGQLLIKPGVEFGPLTPAGARMLDAIKQVAAPADFDVTITSARDGVHSGPGDPHKLGEAFDLRTKTLQAGQKQALLQSLRVHLYLEPRRFYAFLEDVGGSNEHLHVQRRAGTTYSIYDHLANL